MIYDIHCIFHEINLICRTDKTRKPLVSQPLNLLELKPVEWRQRQDDGEGLSTGGGGGGCEVEEDLSDVPVVRSVIPVSDFPHYVLDMTDETKNDDSKLAIEYSVGD